MSQNRNIFELAQLSDMEKKKQKEKKLSPESHLSLYKRLFSADQQWSLEHSMLDEAISHSKQENEEVQKIRNDLIHAAANLGYKVHPIPEDGNCFYHAVRDQLRRNLDLRVSHEQLRALATHHILNNLELYKKYEVDINEFVLQISHPGKWADELHIVAVTRALNISIVIIRSDKAESNFYLRSSSNTTIYLGYEVGLHYQTLELEDKTRNLSLQRQILLKYPDILYAPCIPLNELRKQIISIDSSHYHELPGFTSIKKSEDIDVKEIKKQEDVNFSSNSSLKFVSFKTLNTAEKEKFTKLMHAIVQNKPKDVLELIKSCDDRIINAVWEKKHTRPTSLKLVSPLCCAVSCFNDQIVEYLLQYGADPNGGELLFPSKSSLIELLLVEMVKFNADQPKHRKWLFGIVPTPIKVGSILGTTLIEATRRIVDLLICYGLKPEIWSNSMLKFADRVHRHMLSRSKIMPILAAKQESSDAYGDENYSFFEGLKQFKKDMEQLQFFKSRNFYPFLSSINDLPQQTYKIKQRLDSLKEEILPFSQIEELRSIPKPIIDLIVEYIILPADIASFLRQKKENIIDFWKEMEDDPSKTKEYIFIWLCLKRILSKDDKLQNTLSIIMDYLDVESTQRHEHFAPGLTSKSGR
jgi:hypothetical protein